MATHDIYKRLVLFYLIFLFKFLEGPVSELYITITIIIIIIFFFLLTFWDNFT